MTNRNEYLRHLDTTRAQSGDYVPTFASDRQPVRPAFRDTRSEAQRAAESSKVQLSVSIAKGKAHNRTGTLRSLFRLGGDL